MLDTTTLESISDSVPPAQALRRTRWRLRRWVAMARYGSARLKSSPLIFGNSFPKSGTHLLTQVLGAFPQIGPAVIQGMGPVLTFERTTGRQRSQTEIVGDLEPLGPGDVAFGHVIATPETISRLCGESVAHFFLIRDLRDVAVSHAFYVTEKAPDHFHHDFYTRELSSPAERLRVSIMGRPELGGSFPDIGARMALYQGWLECPWVCTLRYEDFISHRQGTLDRLLACAEGRGFELRIARETALARLAAAIDPRRSPTFRKGQIGGWVEHFSPEHKRLFKEVGGELLIQLGYETGYDW